MLRLVPRSPIARVALGAAGTVVLAAAWYLGSPLFIRTTTYEALPGATATAASPASPATGAATGTITPSAPTAAATSGPVTLATGELRFVDALHHGTGPVSILRLGERAFARFEDVMITNAPDIHVYLSRETGGKWSESTSLYLGPLKATSGSFNYEIPAGTDLTPYRSVVVWCRQFSVLITWADLTTS